MPDTSRTDLTVQLTAAATPTPAKLSAATPATPLVEPVTCDHPVVLSYGLGVDSTAILLRWIHEPTSRDFPLSDLTVVTAMTGDEWDQTRHDVETHVLPLLAEHRVRYIQVARAGRSVARDGITVLSDTRTPTLLHIEGDYRLSDEMTQAGTIPQTGGARLCSVHAKGDVLDPAIAALTRGRPYRHIIGFEAREARRAVKDQSYNTSTRTGEYPLIEWGWDRHQAESYIESLTGARHLKSACTYCPFALATKTGRAATLDRYLRSPAAGISALLMEHVALALNPKQGLIGGERLIDALTNLHDHDGSLDQVTGTGTRHSLSGRRKPGDKLTPAALLAAFQDRLERTEHALYRVRRILRPRESDPTKLANASRAVTRLHTGSRSECLTELARRAHCAGTTPVTDGLVHRAHLIERGTALPTREEFLTVAPALVHDKQAPQFEQWWATRIAA